MPGAPSEDASMVSIIPLAAFSDNYVWAIRAGDRVVVVDPGDDEPVAGYLARERATLAAISSPTTIRTTPAASPTSCAERAGDRPGRESIPGRTLAVGGGDRVDVPGIGLQFDVLDVPGHTSGHIAFVGRDAGWGSPVLFCGDTLFAAGCGRLFEGTADQMWASLSALAALPAETRVFCAHEYTIANLRFAGAVEPANPEIAERVARERAKRERGLPTLPSTIAEERRTNPFLRVADPQVRAIAEAQAGRKLAGDAEVFRALRDWKNAF
jgi:hydroxyacylglutathione hydrolase